MGFVNQSRNSHCRHNTHNNERYQHFRKRKTVFVYFKFAQTIIHTFSIAYLKLNNDEEKNNTESTEIAIQKESPVKIRYAYTYNVPTADSLNEIQNKKTGKDFIKVFELYLEGEELDKVVRIINILPDQERQDSAKLGDRLCARLRDSFLE